MKKPIILSSILLALVTLLVVMTVLKQNPQIAESWSNGFSRGYITAMSEFTRLLPFSLTEVFFLILILSIITLVVFIIIDLAKKEKVKALTKALIIGVTVFAVIDLYNASCGFNYNRKAMELPFYTEHVDKSEYKDIYNYYANDLNTVISELSFTEGGDVDNNLTIGELSQVVENSYSIITSDYFYSSRARGKKMTLFSWLYRELQITGVTFNVFAEPNIDYLATQAELPFVIAHELAHTKGVMREDEANLLAFYICLNSESPYLRFSAYSIYYSLISVVTGAYYMSEEDRENIVKINPQYSRTMIYMYNYWKEHDLLGKIGDFINDLYIKNSGISEGTSSYHGGTEVIVDPETHEIVPNVYQQLYFEKYYRNNV